MEWRITDKNINDVAYYQNNDINRIKNCHKNDNNDDENIDNNNNGNNDNYY